MNVGNIIYMESDSFAKSATTKHIVNRANKDGADQVTFWIGLIIGFLGGGVFGVLIMALCISRKIDPYKSDDE